VITIVGIICSIAIVAVLLFAAGLVFGIALTDSAWTEAHRGLWHQPGDLYDGIEPFTGKDEVEP